MFKSEDWMSMHEAAQARSSSAMLDCATLRIKAALRASSPAMAPLVCAGTCNSDSPFALRVTACQEKPSHADVSQGTQARDGCTRSAIHINSSTTSPAQAQHKPDQTIPGQAERAAGDGVPAWPGQPPAWLGHLQAPPEAPTNCPARCTTLLLPPPWQPAQHSQSNFHFCGLSC